MKNSRNKMNTEKMNIEIINDKKLLNKVSINAKKNLGVSWKKVAKIYYDIYLEEVNNKLI